MKNILHLVLLVLGLILSNSIIAQEDVIMHHVLIIDKTGSMVGQGDGNPEPIWDEAVESIQAYLSNIEDGDLVTVYKFALNPSEPKSLLLGDKNRETLLEYIANIVPDGQYTAIYKALKKAFDEANSMIPAGYEVKSTNFYLFTDGLDNASEISFTDAMDVFDMNYGDEDFIIVKQLREDVEIPKDVIVAAESDCRIDIPEPGLNKKEFIIQPQFEVLYYNFYGKDKSKIAKQYFKFGGNADISGEIVFTTDGKVECKGGNFVIADNKELPISKVIPEITIPLELVNGDITGMDTINAEFTYSVVTRIDDVEIIFNPKIQKIMIINSPGKIVKIKGF